MAVNYTNKNIYPLYTNINKNIGFKFPRSFYFYFYCDIAALLCSSKGINSYLYNECSVP